MSHSKYSPSSCERWWDCPGSLKLIESMDVVDASSPYAREGTAAHAVAEAHVMDWPIPGEVDGYPVDEDMIRHGKQYAGFIKQLPFVKGLWFTERKVKLGAYDFAFGTADYIQYDEPTKTLTICDYKYGQGVKVDAKHNKQLLYYACAAADTLRLWDGLQTVVLYVLQPRMDNISGWCLQVDDLRKFHTHLTQKIIDIENGESLLSPGDHCKFCKAKPICPAIKNHIQNKAGAIFGELPPFEEIDAASLPKVEEMTPEQISQFLNSAQDIIDWCKSIQSYAHIQAEKGIKIPGYKLVSRRSNRVWIDKEYVEEELAFLGDARYTHALKSPAQIEKLVKDKALLDGLWVKPEAGKVLAKIDDDRPERQSEIEEAFADFI